MEYRFWKNTWMSLLPLLVLLASSEPFEKPQPPRSPNIVLIFADDLGYGDLSCYGALDYQTPNLDRLAAEGMRFTNFLAAQAVCSASRAALLTGCYPNRIGISGAFGPRSRVGLHPDETTIAELLREKGYATAIFGKWHLGDHPDLLPTRQGFDEFFGIPYSNDMWPIHYDGKPITDTSNHRKKSFPLLPLLQQGDTLREMRTLDDQAQLTGLLTEKAVDFIRRNRRKPFFLYLPHPMPHVPIAASARFKGKSRQGLYGDVIMELDWSVGEIRKALRENGLDKNTLLIFTSDNGPWINYGNHAGSTGGLREGKGTSFEGGNRVPCIMNWKGLVPEGLVCNQLASTLDILPTIAQVCGTKLPERPIDGVSLWTLLKGELDTAPRKVFYYYYRQNNLEAVRQGDWKLVLAHPGRTYVGQAPGKDGFPGPAPERHPHALGLYDLRRDPGERYDVKDFYPEIYQGLLQLAETAREDLGDELSQRPGKNRRPGGEARW